MKMTGIRLSHSALQTFLTCERKFQIDRLLEGEQKKEDFPATVFGRAFGAGIATYLIEQDSDKALFEGWKAYYPILEDSSRTEEVLYNLLIVAFSKLDDLLLDWEIAVFQGKPAVELSFRLNINETCYFVGYVDVVLKNRWTGKYAILENKSTGMNLLDLDPLYKNSGQALGYSIILDIIAGQENSQYDVIYCIGKLNSKTSGGFAPTIIISEYAKTLQDRLNWFIALSMDVNRLEQMLELNVFPMRGDSCLQYMRPCKHFGVCHMQALDSYKTIEEDKIDYQFVLNLEEVIAEHMERS